MMVLLLACLVSDSESEGESDTSTAKRQKVTPAKTRVCAEKSKATGVWQLGAIGVCMHVHGHVYACVPCANGVCYCFSLCLGCLLTMFHRFYCLFQRTIVSRLGIMIYNLRFMTKGHC